MTDDLQLTKGVVCTLYEVISVFKATNTVENMCKRHVTHLIEILEGIIEEKKEDMGKKERIEEAADLLATCREDFCYVVETFPTKNAYQDNIKKRLVQRIKDLERFASGGECLALDLEKKNAPVAPTSEYPARSHIIFEGIQIKSEEIFHDFCRALSEIEEKAGVGSVEIEFRDIFVCPWIPAANCRKTPMEEMVADMCAELGK